MILNSPFGIPIVGVMNIQFILYHEEVYVLEVNPRASRTVPIMSKMTDLPMVKELDNKSVQ